MNKRVVVDIGNGFLLNYSCFDSVALFVVLEEIKPVANGADLRIRFADAVVNVASQFFKELFKVLEIFLDVCVGFAVILNFQMHFANEATFLKRCCSTP